MHVGTDFLKLPPVAGQYWSLFQCSMLGTGGTCDATVNQAHDKRLQHNNNDSILGEMQ